MRKLLLSLAAAAGLSALATVAASQDEFVRKGAGAPVGDALVLKAGLTAQFEGGFANNDDTLDADTANGRNGGFVNGRA